MDFLAPFSLSAYWSAPAVAANLIIFANIFGALLLGLIIGYERSYHGRAAGMRTYGLVCMASAALTVIAGFPGLWFGGQATIIAVADPTRIIQGIVTGIGFLCAGVIMKEGLNISGLTTSASIWSSAAVGIMVGIGFYAAAILLAILSALIMMGVSKLEAWLPSRPAISIVLRFRSGYVPRESTITQSMLELGYDIAWGTLLITFKDDQPEWHFVSFSLGKNQGEKLTDLAHLLASFEGVENFQLSHARN